jgi:hypothetical protein
MGGFVNDLKIGKAVEQAVLVAMTEDNPLWKHAVAAEGLDKKADFRLNLGVEVKYDSMSQRTGNVAIEVGCAGKPSGISATCADFWVTVMLGEHAGTYLTDTADLRYLVQGRPVIKGGDRNAAELVLLKFAEFDAVSRRLGPAPAFLSMKR